jgi:alkylation response protein AidB-like acyl-CoA dehydrogenase
MPFLPSPAAIAAEFDERFGSFVADRVNPGAEARDASAQPVPRELLVEAARLGLVRYGLPGEIGGEGRDIFAWGALLEQLGVRCEDAGFCGLMSLYRSVAEVLHDLGRPDLDERYVRPMVEGRCLGAWSFSEGRDPFSFASSSVECGEAGGGYRLDASKILVTGGLMADVFVVYVGDGRGDVRAFLVERSDPGVSVEPELVMGFRSSGLARLHLRGVRVPADRLLVPRDGLSHAQAYLNRKRATTTAPVVGGMRQVLDLAIAHLRRTERYGLPLDAFANVRAGLGRVYVAIETARTVLYRALDRLRWEGADPRWDAQVSLAKYYVSEQALFAADTLLRLTGSDGYRQGPFERFARDAAALVAAAGAQDILQVMLGMELVTQGGRHS